MNEPRGLAIALIIGSYASQCNDEGYRLEVAEEYLWLLKGKSIEVTEEQCLAAYDVYRKVNDQCQRCAVQALKEQVSAAD